MQVTIVCGGDLIHQRPFMVAIGSQVLAVGEIDASNCDAEVLSIHQRPRPWRMAVADERMRLCPTIGREPKQRFCTIDLQVRVKNPANRETVHA
ncbi:hypothetical protein NF681_02325 (plasmid) [Comamonadaceae bacterium OTU4NAUVB1]|nr:hypothetical protein NF681_02325 [Comamonadaceae bacterium OTU4NAUVB1]